MMEPYEVAREAEAEARKLCEKIWLRIIAIWDESPPAVQQLAAVYLARELCQHVTYIHHLDTKDPNTKEAPVEAPLHIGKYQDIDPVHERGGYWWFQPDEASAYEMGPYSTEEQARKEYSKYGKTSGPDSKDISEDKK